jgi:hypothetical protein
LAISWGQRSAALTGLFGHHTTGGYMVAPVVALIGEDSFLQTQALREVLGALP